MDAIGHEAGVSKATLYAYFASKAALMEGACEHVAETFLARADAARSLETLEARVIGILGAELTYFFELMSGSPHAQEIVEDHERFGSRAIPNAETKLLAMLAEELGAADERGEIRLELMSTDAERLAGLLHRTAHAAGYKVAAVERQREHLAECVRFLLGAVRPRAGGGG